VSIETLKPLFEGLLECRILKDTVAAAGRPKGAPPVVHECGYFGSFTSKIEKILTDQNTVDVRIDGHMPLVLMTIVVRVKGIALPPWRSDICSVVNIVATALLSAASPMRLLGREARICVVLVKTDDFGNAHGVNEAPAAADAAISTPIANYPVTRLCRSAYLRLAGG
jgi:hypothetical protein